MFEFYKIRIILLALMLLGCCSSFAQNSWGNPLVTTCYALMAVTFIVELLRFGQQYLREAKNTSLTWSIWGPSWALMFVLIAVFNKALSGSMAVPIIFSFWLLLFGFYYVIALLVYTMINHKDKAPFWAAIENYILFAFFSSILYKSLLLPGSSVFFILSAMLLMAFYVGRIIFFDRLSTGGRSNFIRLLSSVYSITILLLGSALCKTMHWPGANWLFYAGIIGSITIVVQLIFRKFEYQGRRPSFALGVSLLGTNILLLFVLSFSIASYRMLDSAGMAPKFYSQDYPPSLGRLTNLRSYDQAQQLITNYDNFIANSKKNGFLK